MIRRRQQHVPSIPPHYALRGWVCVVMGHAPLGHCWATGMLECWDAGPLEMPSPISVVRPELVPAW